MSLNWLKELPTTNLRIFVTLCVLVVTAATYLGLAFITRVFPALDFKTWVPADSWLMFLAVALGLDWGQFHSKRATEFKDERKRKKAAVPPPADEELP